MNNEIAKENSDWGSVINELDMISTILLPPEDAVYDSYMHDQMKSNTYFNSGQSRDVYIQDSMISNYGQILKNNKLSNHYLVDQIHMSKSKCRNNNDLL